jgi:hypothetical protein
MVHLYSLDPRYGLLVLVDQLVVLLLFGVDVAAL